MKEKSENHFLTKHKCKTWSLKVPSFYDLSYIFFLSTIFLHVLYRELGKDVCLWLNFSSDDDLVERLKMSWNAFTIGSV